MVFKPISFFFSSSYNQEAEGRNFPTKANSSAILENEALAVHFLHGEVWFLEPLTEGSVICANGTEVPLRSQTFILTSS